MKHPEQGKKWLRNASKIIVRKLTYLLTFDLATVSTSLEKYGDPDEARIRMYNGEFSVVHLKFHLKHNHSLTMELILSLPHISRSNQSW